MSAITIRSFLSDPRLVYTFDAGLSAVMGVVFVALAGPLTDLLGWSLPATVILGAGLFLLPWALFNLFLGRSPGSGRALLAVNIVGDGLWVVISLVLLLANSAQMSAIGVTMLGVQAIAVSGVVAIKLKGFSTERG